MDEKTNTDYKHVAVHDDDVEELLSSTEVDEQEVRELDKRQWRKARQDARESKSKTRIWIARFRRFRWLIDVILLLFNICLSLLLLQGFQTENSSGTLQVGSSFAGTGPDLPTKVVKFNADERFVPKNTTEFFDDSVLQTWNTIMPAGAGWGTVTQETFFTTSMTHQLHCVFMMARIYASLTGNMPEKLQSDYHSHYLHCVDYLRQGIMCSADMTMEPHEQTDADDNGPLDGSWNGHHVCKDYNHVIPYLEEQIADGVRKVLPIDD